MRIICPTCASHYEVETDKIGATGQLVRCAQCRDVWLARVEETLTPALVTTAPATAFSAAAEAERRPPAAPIDFESAKQRLRRSAGGGRARAASANLLSIAAVGATALAVLVGFRGLVVSHIPSTAPAFAAIGLPVNKAGLALRDVRSVMLAEGDKTVLSLEGQIANLRDGATPVPDLKVVVRDGDKTALYTWTTAAPKTELGKGETIAFRSRLAAPPLAGKDVRVSFADAGAVAVSPADH